MSRSLDIANISVRPNKRLRPLDEAHVDMLVKSMLRQKEAGLPPLIAPIEVSRSGQEFLLTDGWHRLEAAKRAGFTKIEAEIVDGDEDKRRLREVEANLARHDLKPLDRPFFVEELCRLVGGLDAPKTKSPDLKNLADQSSTRLGLADEVSARINLSRTRIYEELKVAQSLKPVRRELESLPVALNRSELARLARLSAGAERNSVIAKLRTGKRFSEAIGQRAPATSKEKVSLVVLKRLWGLAPKPVRHAFLRWLHDDGELVDFATNGGGG